MQPTCALVGLGGIGAPAALVLARSASAPILRLIDDDIVDVLNLHRQILFEPADVGQSKIDAAARHLRALGAEVESRAAHAVPENLRALLEGVSVVIDGSDNYATKLMLADACSLWNLPLVTGAAVEWRGTVFVRGATGGCYRCLFEDLPPEGGPACADVGVMGPLVGLVGVLCADAALRLLAGTVTESEILSVDARGGVRRRAVGKRRGCALCGSAPQVTTVERRTYLAALAKQPVAGGQS